MTKENYTINKTFINAEGFEHKGSVVKLNPTCKIVYLYMFNNHRDCQGKPYYEDQLTIANNLGISESSVKNSLNILKQCDLILVKKFKTGENRRHNQYIIFDVLDVPAKFVFKGK